MRRNVFRSVIMPSLTTAIGLAFLLTACGGSRESAPTPQASASDLPNLVLAVEEVSVDGTILPIDPEDSGPQLKSDYTDSGFDSEWRQAFLEKYNWQAAYYQDFGDGRQGSPVFDASVMVELYDTPSNAAAALAEQFAHIVTLEGQTHDGITLESAEIFDVTEFNTRGVTLRWRLADGSGYTMTNIDFVRGPIVVDVGTATTDERDLQPSTLELVRQADAHLRSAGLTARAIAPAIALIVGSPASVTASQLRTLGTSG